MDICLGICVEVSITTVIGRLWMLLSPRAVELISSIERISPKMKHGLFDSNHGATIASDTVPPMTLMKQTPSPTTIDYFSFSDTSGYRISSSNIYLTICRKKSTNIKKTGKTSGYVCFSHIYSNLGNQLTVTFRNMIDNLKNTSESTYRMVNMKTLLPPIQKQQQKS